MVPADFIIVSLVMSISKFLKMHQKNIRVQLREGPHFVLFIIMVPVYCDSYHNNGAFARICLYYYCISGKFESCLQLSTLADLVRAKFNDHQ